MKKAAISTVFIYAISSIIIILVVYFGYRGISAMQEANEEAIMQRLKVKMQSDFSELSASHGTIARFTYGTGREYNKFCFVDLELNETSELLRNQFLASDYPIIWDSVESGNPSNAFALGSSVLALNIGKLGVKCAPYVYCINISGNRIDFFAEGSGDEVLILGQNATPC